MQPLPWLVLLCALGACGDPALESGRPPPSAANEAGRGADPCPAQPVDKLCAADATVTSFTQAPLRSCPKDIQAFLTAFCAKQDLRLDHVSAIRRSLNSCGGITLDVQDVSNGESQYYYDADGDLVGGHSRDYHTADGCSVSQAYGKACAVIENTTFSSPCLAAPTGVHEG